VRTCIACKSELAPEAQRCDVCRSKQKLRLCLICRKAIPARAERCNECQSYQGRWRKRLQFWAAAFLAVSTIFTLISGGASGYSYVFDSFSHTRFKVTSSDDLRIYTRVWNTGRKPSTLVGFRLLFDGLPGKELPLVLSEHDQSEATNVVPGGAPVKIGLARVVNPPLPAMRSKRTADDDAVQKLFTGAWDDRHLTLEVKVEESIDPWCPWNFFRATHTRTDRFPAGRISEFVRGSLGGS